MELQFHKTPVACLKQAVCERTVREYTQELKIPEGLPEVGSVICAWGQVLVRGKQWDSDSVGTSGGIQVWVLYTPEEGDSPNVLEAWIPFEQLWDLRDVSEDGKILIMPALHQVDARVVSQRKLMLKAVIGISCRAFVSDRIETSNPGAMPEDVQLLVRETSALIPAEIGERAFTVDEELTVPSQPAKPEKLIYCTVSPLINEVKVMARKLVFRGNLSVHMVYMADGRLRAHNWDVPIAQYCELEQDYEPEAMAAVYPVLTSFDTELGEDGSLRLKAGLLGQFMICDQKNLRIVEDAFSTLNQLELQRTSLEYPRVVQQNQQNMIAEARMNPEGTPVDTVFYGELPKVQTGEQGTIEQYAGRFQMLHYDNDGVLRCTTEKWEHSELVEDNRTPITNMVVEQVSADGAQLQLNTYASEIECKEVVCGISSVNALQKDPNRPSLILRRMGEGSVWELAKRTGSTVAQIQSINGFETEPTQGEMLILPVS